MIRFLRIPPLALLLSWNLAPSQPAVPVKWACIGNSITAGAYPSRLATRLGPSFTVENDGKGWATMLKSGDSSYWKMGRLPQVFALKPDIITIALGTNDSKTINWDDSANFVKDYTAMVDTLLGIIPKPQIWLVLPPPTWKNEAATNFPSPRESVIRNSVIPKIRQVAAARDLEVIDLHAPLTNRLDLFLPDSLHPTSAGADSIASIIFRAFKSKVTRVACIGNSITQGNNWNADAYPGRLGMLLGRSYLVENDGVSGATLLKAGDKPYWKEARFRNVFAMEPHFITIKLGTNDTKPQNWNQARFRTDLRAMVDTLAGMPSKPKIWLCLPAPIWPNNFGINSTIMQNEVIPVIRQVAVEKSLPVLDLNAPMQPFQAYFSDGVHPNNAGLDSIAHWVYRVLRAAPVANGPAPAPDRMILEARSLGAILRIRLPETVSGQVEILSAAGKKVLAAEARPGVSDHSTAGLSSGIYWLRVITPDGSLTRRLVLGLPGN
jgi:lysophospholipase L1-like esterase